MHQYQEKKNVQEKKRSGFINVRNDSIQEMYTFGEKTLVNVKFKNSQNVIINAYANESE